jgi:Lon protease-like protein
MNDDEMSLASFNGRVRLFPLPNLVLFPQVVQALHIFEPRYRQMVEDALKTDRLITLILLRPGWENDYDHSPACFSVGCLGRIAAEKRLDDGRFILLLRGLARVGIEEELSCERLYRQAQANILMETEIPPPADSVRLRHQLANLLMPRVTGPADVQKQLGELFASELPLGTICDHLSFHLPLPLSRKQGLLEQRSVADRAAHLIQFLESTALPPPSGMRRYPPDFSLN